MGSLPERSARPSVTVVVIMPPLPVRALIFLTQPREVAVLLMALFHELPIATILITIPGVVVVMHGVVDTVS